MVMKMAASVVCLAYTVLAIWFDLQWSLRVWQELLIFIAVPIVLTLSVMCLCVIDSMPRWQQAQGEER